MDAISQTTFSNAFSWMKVFEFRLEFHWSLFPRVELTIFQQCSSHYLNQCWLLYRRIYASLGLNELKLPSFPLCFVRCRVIHDRDISKVYSIYINQIHVLNICFSDACLHTLFTVIFTWYNLCEILFHTFSVHKTQSCHEDSFLIADGNAGYIDNLQCRQRWQKWHCGNSRFSVFVHLFKCSIRFKPNNI